MSNRFLRRAFDRIIVARELQARRYVNGRLMHLDDATLKAIGKTREQLRAEGVASDFF